MQASERGKYLGVEVCRCVELPSTHPSAYGDAELGAKQRLDERGGV
jgi:hypothetical protein